MVGLWPTSEPLRVPNLADRGKRYRRMFGFWPIYTPAAELTDKLRGGRETEYAALLTEILSQRDALAALNQG